MAGAARSAMMVVGDFETQISCTSCTTINRAAKTLTALLSGAAKLLMALSSFPGNQLVHYGSKGPVDLFVYYIIMGILADT